MFKADDIIRIKGDKEYNPQQYCVVSVFRNEDKPDDCFMFVRWRESHTNAPRVVMASPEGFELVPIVANEQRG